MVAFHSQLGARIVRAGALGLLVGLSAVVVSTPAHASPINLALGASTAGTSSGWGGGNTPSNLVDGISQYFDTWAHGIAFCGNGFGCSAGGPRYAQINLLTPETFDRVVVWHHGDDHFPATSLLEYWDGAAWQAITTGRIIGPDSDYHPVAWGSRSETLTFDPITAMAIRYGFDNTQLNILGGQITHGWLYEVEVFEAVPEPSAIVLFGTGLLMVASATRRRLSARRR